MFQKIAKASAAGRKILSAALVMTMFFNGAVFSAVTTNAAASYEASFDENNIVVRFSVISDTHIQRADSDSTTKFKKAMAQLRKIEDLSRC